MEVAGEEWQPRETPQRPARFPVGTCPLLWCFSVPSLPGFGWAETVSPFASGSEPGMGPSLGADFFYSFNTGLLIVIVLCSLPIFFTLNPLDTSWGIISNWNHPDNLFLAPERGSSFTYGFSPLSSRTEPSSFIHSHVYYALTVT